MLKSVTSLQIFSLFNLYIFITIIAFLVETLISGSGFSAPLSTVLGAFLGLLLVYPSYKVALSRPDQFLSEFGQEIVGSVLHTIFIIIIIIANFSLAAVNLRNLSDFLLMKHLIGTPSWAIVVVFSACIVYAIRSGLPTIFRVAQGIFLVTAIAFLFIPFLSAAEIETKMAIALITHLNLRELGAGVYLNTVVYGELAFLFLLFPYLKRPQKVYKTFFITTISTLVIILSHLIPIILSFGPDLAGNMIYPDMELIRFIRNSSFFETLDPILIILWLTSLFVKISFTLFTVISCIANLTKTKDHKPFALSVTSFTAVLSLSIARSQPELNQFVLTGALPFLIIAEFVIPITYWIVNCIRYPKSKTNKPATK